ncbi:hypothetical protein [Eoetvoesiella caeni]|uniref:Uncharacterized protein n=1 Tax=Eoetvoesiella caeni TaxID=645616 RepID=A0A366HCP4_9BURK|nr:hypothetical protein [Eoetvoesiella caeni]MCI2809339.1 hypothetical protein [Eoetvoesiella caeni]NYT54480.1 hypothetical protein [Eoetvoesiella caeni]RBP39332.1 hypothetical protein DFR37_105125 [Eoetvoesiella caeni]
MTTTNAPTDLEIYSKAMISGNFQACVAIEQRHDLYGYPPEVVSVGLKAIAEGQDMDLAITNYLHGAPDDNQD